MRILIATHYWHPHQGGIETVAREQAVRLVQRGHAVSVITSRLPGDPAFMEDEGVRIHRIRSANPLEKRGIPFPLFSPSLLTLTLKLMNEHDVAFMHSHVFVPSVATVLLARVKGKPSVLLQHNTYVRYSFPWNIVETFADNTLARITLGLAHRILAVSRETRQYLLKLSPRKEIQVLHNGVDTVRFCPARDVTEKQHLRRQLGVAEQAFIALTVRRLVLKNGLDTLIEAAAQLDQKAVHVVIVGKGPDQLELERVLAEKRIRNVTLAGFVPNDILPLYYRMADVFVLPSRSGEGFPMAVLEALASGLSVIATRSGGHVDMVRDGETGWLVPPDQPIALADALVNSFESPLYREELALKARAVAERLDWDRQVEVLEEYLKEVASERE